MFSRKSAVSANGCSRVVGEQLFVRLLSSGRPVCERGSESAGSRVAVCEGCLGRPGQTNRQANHSDNNTYNTTDCTNTDNSGNLMIVIITIMILMLVKFPGLGQRCGPQLPSSSERHGKRISLSAGISHFSFARTLVEILVPWCGIP